jgi:hypothetical protein
MTPIIFRSSPWLGIILTITPLLLTCLPIRMEVNNDFGLNFMTIGSTIEHDVVYSSDFFIHGAKHRITGLH